MNKPTIITDSRNRDDDFVVAQLRKLGYTVVTGKNKRTDKFKSNRTFKLGWGDFAYDNNVLCAVDIKSSGDGVTELAQNFCGSNEERARVFGEIFGAIKYGGRLCFLVATPYGWLKEIDDLEKWCSPTYKNDQVKNGKVIHKKGETYTKIKGTTLAKTIKTISTPNKYADGFTVDFVFCHQLNAGVKIIEILEKYKKK